jgi:hypothetical protein
MSEREFRLPKLKELRKKARGEERAEEKKARVVGAMSVPDEVGQARTVVERAKASATAESGSPDEEGVVARLQVAEGDRRSRPLDIPRDVREGYGREG